LKGKTAVKEIEIRGLPVSLGIESGPAYVLQEKGYHFPLTRIEVSEIDRQIDRLEDAWDRTIRQIEETRRDRTSGERQLLDDIIDIHAMLAKDIPKHTRAQTVDLIRNERMCAETAFHFSLQDLIRKLGQSPLQRGEDVADIGYQVIRNLVGMEMAQFDDIEEPIILIAEDLSPSLTARLPREKVLAFATTRGSRTSHTAIMARALEIPAVVGLPSLLDQISDRAPVIVDGDRGRVVVNPSRATIEVYRKRREEAERRADEQMRYKDLEAETLDGFTIRLAANIELPEEVDAVIAHGGRGIGLYRTEFLFLNRADLPTEEEQYLAYSAVAKALAPMRVTLRTLDIGGDKFLTSINAPEEINPFMGWRGIRFCLEEPEIFGTQLRSILRASHHGNLAVMFPMISEIRELKLALAALEKAKADLKARGIPYNKNLEIGAMIEVPSAALMMKGLAPLVDFFSIGTNDLIQYTMAVDRGNERTSSLYNPLNPGVLRLIQEVVDAAHAVGKRVCMCGEMAGELGFTLFLLGMFVDELSMSPIALPEVKRLIRSVSLVDAVEVARRTLEMTDPDEIRHYLNEQTSRMAPWTEDFISRDEARA
jgi:phosphotransferase system enzyme I (PtsI)